MKYEVGDILTIKGEEYAVVDAILYENVDYILVNKFEGEEPTQIFIPYEIVDGGLVKVEDEKILERLLPIFSKNVQRMIDLVNLKNQYEIN